MLPVEPAQTVSGPAIEHVPSGLTFTVFSHESVQPPALTIVFKVKDPAAPAVTEMGEPSCEPTIDPLPEISVWMEAPWTSLVIVNRLPLDPAQRASGPSMLQ